MSFVYCVCRRLVLLILCLSYVTPPGSSQTFDPQKLELLKKAILTIETTISRASYENLGSKECAGFICDKGRGWIVTTHDVVGHGGVIGSYKVTLPGGQKMAARLIYADPSKNFAVLSIDLSHVLVPLEEINVFAETVSLGEDVLLLGKEGEQDICQFGQVASQYESVSVFPQQALRLSLNAVGACTGAPVLNQQGHLLGLVIEKESTFVSALWGHFIRDALAELRAGKIPVRRTVNALIYARSLVDSMRYNGFPKEQLQAYMEKYPEALGKGLVVASVLDEKTSTLRPGDIVWSIDGQEIGPERYLMEKSFNATSADQVTVGVFRGGKRIQVQAALETMDLFPIREMIFWGGAMFYEADRRVQQLFNIPRGRVVVSHVLPGSPFSNVFGSFMPEGGGLLIVMEKIHGQSVKTLADLKNLIPQLEQEKYISLVYRDFGISTEKEGGPFSINRRPKMTGVDFLVKQSPPERLVFDGEHLTWTSLPLEKASPSPKLPVGRVSPDKASGEGGGSK